MRRFEARWDGALRLTTALGCAAAVLAPAWAALVLSRDGRPAAVLLLLLPGVALPLAAALAPRGYALGGGRLVVERALRPVVVPLADVRSAGLVPDGAARELRRAGGASEIFGYSGRYRGATLGAVRMLATRRTGLVVVETARERLVLSPEGPERFVEALLASAPAAERWGAA